MLICLHPEPLSTLSGQSHIGYPAGDTASYAYDDQNRCYGLEGYSELYYQGERMTGRVLANNLCTQYGYQANNRVSELWHHTGGMDNTGASYPGSNVSDRYYGYAPDGQITWSERQADGGASGSALDDGSGENYGYNADASVNAFGILYANTYQKANSQGDSAASPGNLTGAPGAGGSGSYSNSYQYDGAGNRSQVSQMGGSITYSADAENRYYGSSYDGNGNTTNSAVGWTYTYDAEGQMSKATRTSDGYVLYFFYDGLGRLVYQSGGIASGAPAIFCYAGPRRIEERLASNNASIYRYFFDAPHGDKIVYRQTTSGSGAASELWYQYDVVGNTTHVSDGNGNILEQYLYDAYGTPYMYNKEGTYLGQTSTQDNRYLFHGSSAYEWLPAAGLYYCRARMYLPVHGRFLQPDPSGFKGGDVNLYRYCENDPTNGFDPSGLVNVVVIGKGTVAVGASGSAGGGYIIGLNSFNPWDWTIAPCTYSAYGFRLFPVADANVAIQVQPFATSLEEGTETSISATGSGGVAGLDAGGSVALSTSGQLTVSASLGAATAPLPGAPEVNGGGQIENLTVGPSQPLLPIMPADPSQIQDGINTQIGNSTLSSGIMQGSVPVHYITDPVDSSGSDSVDAGYQPSSSGLISGLTIPSVVPDTDAGTSSGASDDSLSGLDYADGGGGGRAVGESGEGWMYEE